MQIEVPLSSLDSSFLVTPYFWPGKVTSGLFAEGSSVEEQRIVEAECHNGGCRWLAQRQNVKGDIQFTLESFNFLGEQLLGETLLGHVFVDGSNQTLVSTCQPIYSPADNKKQMPTPSGLLKNFRDIDEREHSNFESQSQQVSLHDSQTLAVHVHVVVLCWKTAD